MKKLLTACLLLGLLATPARAAEEETIQAAEDLLDSLAMQTMLEQSIAQMLDIQLKQQPQLEPFRAVMMAFFNKHMSFASIKRDMAIIYADAFTAGELREMAAFNRTPTGAKAVQLMPELFAKGSQFGMTRVQQNLGELQRMIEAEAARLR